MKKRIHTIVKHTGCLVALLGFLTAPPARSEECEDWEEVMEVRLSDGAVKKWLAAEFPERFEELKILHEEGEKEMLEEAWEEAVHFVHEYHEIELFSGGDAAKSFLDIEKRYYSMYTLGDAYAEADSEEARARIEEQLREQLGEIYTLETRLLKLEVEHLADELKEMRAELAAREAEKAEIMEEDMKEILAELREFMEEGDDFSERYDEDDEDDDYDGEDDEEDES